MKHIEAYLLIGLLVGTWVGVKYGKARARWLRHLSDFRKTRAALSELFGGLLKQWSIAVRLGLAIAALVFGLLCLLVFG